MDTQDCQSFLSDIAEQVDELIVGKTNKSLFKTHAVKVIKKAEKYNDYIHAEYNKAKKQNLLSYKEKPKGDYYWFSSLSLTTDQTTWFDYFENEIVVFWSKGKLNPDPLDYLFRMIWGCAGVKYRELELLDYQLVLLAIIHDAQNWQAGRERIYFNPHLEKKTFPDRICLAAWSCLADYHNTYDFRHIRQTIDTALFAVKANLANEQQETKNQLLSGKAEDKKEMEQDIKPVKELQAENVFKKTGDFWTVKFQGKTKHIADCAGLPYIKLLLNHQGETFTTTEFVSLSIGKPVTLASGDNQLDEEAKKDYKSRLADIEHRLQKAKNNNDIGTQEKLEEDKASIMAELEKAAGFGKHSKKLNPEFDKYRLSTGNAILRAIKQIEKHIPAFAEHLRDAIPNPHSGTSLSYRPSKPTEWAL